MDGYGKILYLPSGGMFYPSTAWAHKIKNNLQLLQIDSSSYDSEFEFMVTLISHYVKLPIDISKLLLQDFFFIWTHIAMTDLYNNNDFYAITSCTSCGKTNKIIVPFDLLEFIQHTAWTPIRQIMTVQSNEFEIVLRHRTVEDNLGYANMRLVYGGNNAIFTCILFLLPQIISIIGPNGKIPEAQWIDVLTNMRKAEIITLYENSVMLHNEIGLNNNLIFNCRVCKANNKAYLYDSIQLCEILSRRQHSQEIQQYFTDIFQTARLPIFTVDSIQSMPLRFHEQITNAINTIDFHAGMMMF